MLHTEHSFMTNKVRYTVTQVAFGWAGIVMTNAIHALGRSKVEKNACNDTKAVFSSDRPNAGARD